MVGVVVGSGVVVVGVVVVVVVGDEVEGEAIAIDKPCSQDGESVEDEPAGIPYSRALSLGARHCRVMSEAACRCTSSVSLERMEICVNPRQTWYCKI